MKDPAFLFYPGDYLRDTQCLTEQAQVAYDRIMCEHMRNICISQTTLNFLTKRLDELERAQIMQILEEVDGGFAIPWVRESIIKRRDYSESRRNNRKSKPENKPQKDNQPPTNISLSYDSHMENENENVIEKEVYSEKGVQGEKQLSAELLSQIPDKVNEFADRALMDLGLLQSCQNKNSKITEHEYVKLVEEFRAVQIHGTDYYHVYQAFKRHLLNSSLLKNWDTNKNGAKTKSGQALSRNLASEIRYDQNGNAII